MKKRSRTMRVIDKICYPALNWLSKVIDSLPEAKSIEDLMLPHQKEGLKRLLDSPTKPLLTGAFHNPKVKEGAYLAGVMNQVPDYEHGPIPWENPGQYEDRLHRPGMGKTKVSTIPIYPGDHAWLKDRIHSSTPGETDVVRFEDTESGQRARFYRGVPSRGLIATLELLRINNPEVYGRMQEMEPKDGLRYALKEYKLPEPVSTDPMAQICGGLYEAIEKARDG